MSTQELVELHRSLIHTWHVVPVDKEEPAWEDLEAALARRVAFLLQHDYEKLVNSMYMLDVSEERFSEAVSACDAETRIARLILDREREKQASREQYTRDRGVEAAFHIRAEKPPAA